MKPQKRKIVLQLKKGSDLENIMKKIGGIVSSQEAIIKVENNIMSISFINSNRNIKEIKSKIREIVMPYSENRINGIKYDNNEMSKILGNYNKTYLEVIGFILNKLGYKTAIEEDGLITSVNKDLLEKISNEVKESFTKISRINASNSTKKLLACILVMRKKSLDIVINAGISSRILEENKNKLYTKYSWKDACEMLNRVV
ncbi:MAG: DUF2067 family protein [Caldisphaera sp.]|jgi:hypothetical protein|nr:DUF2067 family protein [Caldisphaera sp.]PMP61167.1 MAG: hypothetical protein C0201_00505 [Caldisphaera sp.]PMP90838.1 MAG: hypothetical protein C0171_04085 [Caldisphaera sp.]